MKKILVTIALLVSTVMLFAQETSTKSPDDQINTLFAKGGKIHLGWMLEAEPTYTQFDGRDVWMAGLSVGMVINHSFTIGLTGHGWTNHNGMYYSNVTDTAGAYLEGGYGGLLLEYTLFPKSVVHVTFPVAIAGGGASYVTGDEYDEWDHDNWGNWDEDHNTLDNDAFFVFEPGVRAEVNLLKFMRLNAGVSYRLVSGLHMVNTSSTLMNNFAATVGLKFGKF